MTGFIRRLASPHRRISSLLIFGPKMLRDSMHPEEIAGVVADVVPLCRYVAGGRRSLNPSSLSIS
jgi:hypothetical protein